MNLKKILIIVVVIIAVSIGGVLLWKGIGTAPAGITPTSQPGVEGQTGGQTGGQTTGGDISKMTDDIYIEVLAHVSVYAQDPNSYASRMNDLFAKYGITQEDVTAYGKELEKDPQHQAEIGQKYMKRAMELRGMGQ